MTRTDAKTKRVCQTPTMFVEGQLFRRYAIFVYVPETTGVFTLGVYDQPDNVSGDQPTSFTLISPGGTPTPLSAPRRDEWSDYEVQVDGDWGVWQLRIEAGPAPCRNELAVRTIGDVDLYARPEPCAGYRGAVCFVGPDEGAHVYTLQVPEIDRLRLNFMPMGTTPEVPQPAITLEPPSGVEAQQRRVRLERDGFSSYSFWRMQYLEATGGSLEGLWRFTVADLSGDYGLGIEQQARVFFNDSPIMPAPQRAEVLTTIEDGSPMPARVELTATRLAREGYAGFPGTEAPYTVFTGRDGSGVAYLSPGVDYSASVSRGFAFDSRTRSVPRESRRIEASIGRMLTPEPGWYGGDCHVHSLYSDGTFTPAQIVEAAPAEGLDWIVLTDHGQGPDVPTVLKAHEEALMYSEPGKFVVVPGEEFSAGGFHANVFNGTVGELADASLQEVIDAARAADAEEHPLTLAWNHPFRHGRDQVGEDLDGLPLIEVWNTKEGSIEHETTRLWWSWLNEGKRVFAETGTDSHHRVDAPYGHRRTYVYLGDESLTADNVVRALRRGRSFVSRGALLYFTTNDELPGATIASGRLNLRVSVDSVAPLGRVEIVGNGRVAVSFDAGGRSHFSGETTIDAAEGWYLAEAFGTEDEDRPLAMTNPVFCVKR